MKYGFFIICNEGLPQDGVVATFPSGAETDGFFVFNARSFRNGVLEQRANNRRKNRFRRLKC